MLKHFEPNVHVELVKIHSGEVVTNIPLFGELPQSWVGLYLWNYLRERGIDSRPWWSFVRLTNCGQTCYNGGTQTEDGEMLVDRKDYSATERISVWTRGNSLEVSEERFEGEHWFVKETHEAADIDAARLIIQDIETIQHHTGADMKGIFTYSEDEQLDGTIDLIIQVTTVSGVEYTHTWNLPNGNAVDELLDALGFVDDGDAE